MTTPRHNPPADLLACYASGSVSPGVALLLASQLDLVPDGRADLARHESLGGALLLAETEETMAPDALEAALARLDGPEEEGPAPAPLDLGPLPAGLGAAIGVHFGQIPWRFRLPGVSEYELPGFTGEKVSLLRARPGSGIPQHMHMGREFTLVLSGAMQDGPDVFRRGDLALHDEQDEHKPRIIGDEVCHCLIVLTGALRFTGRFSRALNYLGE